MSKLTDPGKDLAKDKAKEERLKAWKRPTTKKAREELREERIKAVRGDKQ